MMVNEADAKLELVENRDAIELVPTWEPQWWWVAVAVVALFGIVLLVSFVRRKAIVEDPRKIEREAYRRARSDLAELGGGDDCDYPVEISIILRRYLADSLGEPALFQTHEEFIARHNALANYQEDFKETIQKFFSRLAQMKYGQEPVEEENTIQLKGESVELLERMHAA